MNSARTYMMAPDDAETPFSELVADTWSQKQPQLPLPHQIVAEVKKQATFAWIWKEKRRGYKRSLIYHTWVTLSSTLLGFALGLVLGVSLSLAIVYSRVMDLSVMPWVITSQTIPIIAIAPMIIVLMAPLGFTGLMPKGVISMYLSYFPIVIGMTKGLRSSDPILEDQMKTWSATAFQTFWLLRLPSALPFLFPAMKIGLAAALVGAVVAELPSGARAGLGARLLVFSYLWTKRPTHWFPEGIDGWEAALLMPVIVVLVILSIYLAVPFEHVFFDGSLRDWLSQQAGISYDQRNALVVGVAMGFAVIPTIFSIAEDAVFGVPKSLSDGSLALGATRWQTLVRVIMPTASPGIFSGLMIGLGRAVGETMIVLMATGNTPLMDWNIFEGMRTLAANIAVEMPESEVGSSHYRILFLAALVLFMFTFVVNTGAEVVRQRLREKYSSL